MTRGGNVFDGDTITPRRIGRCRFSRFSVPEKRNYSARLIIRRSRFTGAEFARCLQPVLHFPRNRRLRGGYDALGPLHRPAEIRFLSCSYVCGVAPVSLSSQLLFLGSLLCVPRSTDLSIAHRSLRSVYRVDIAGALFRWDGYTKLRPIGGSRLLPGHRVLPET